MFQHWEWNCHFDGAHGVWSDVVYIVVERDALSAEIEILCRGDVAGRSISQDRKSTRLNSSHAT